MAENQGDILKDESQEGAAEKDATAADDDINKLLDSALDDMSRPAAVASTEERPEVPEVPEGWSDEFIQNAAAQFENMLRALATQGVPPADGEIDPSSVAPFQLGQLSNIAMQFAGSAGMPPPATDAAGQQDPLMDTMRQLSQGAQSLKDMSEEDMLAKMFGDLGFQPNSDPSQAASGLLGGLDSVLPMMESMMRGLVSKDVLYPSMKDLCTKYPDWLSQNKATLAAEQYEAFERQYQLMNQVCDEFDRETENDTEEVQAERFLKVMELMQRIQACGPPPPELTSGGEAAPETTMDPAAAQAAAEQCSIM